MAAKRPRKTGEPPRNGAGRPAGEEVGLEAKLPRLDNMSAMGSGKINGPPRCLAGDPDTDKVTDLRVAILESWVPGKFELTGVAPAA